MELVAKASTTTTQEMYKEFFKYYYKEKTKVLVIITTVIGAVLVLAGVYWYRQNWSIFSVAILFAGGVMLEIYPRFVYIRPYNAVKDNKITTSFEFYTDKLIEINAASKEEYEYDNIVRIVETERYLYIYYSREQASVVDKSCFSYGTHDDLKSVLLKRIPDRYEMV